MVRVVVERTFEAPIDPDDFETPSERTQWCLDLHGANLQRSYIAGDRRRMVCIFDAPDAESVRDANRRAEALFDSAWTAKQYDAPDEAEGAAGEGETVVVERRFDHPALIEELQAIEDSGAWCLDEHGVRFLHTYLSLDGTRMVCVYRAPDAESVRLAQRQIGLPVERAWSTVRVVEGTGA